MLRPEEIAGFRAFGYVVIRGCLSPEQFQSVDRAFDRAMADAPRFDQNGDNGSRMKTFPEDADPELAALVGNERLMQAMRELWSSVGIYVGGFLLDNRDDTAWHSTGTPGEGPDSIRASVYLESTNAAQGALCVLAGSHHNGYNRQLFDAFGYFAGDGTRLRIPNIGAPGAVSIPSEPGDVVLWHTRMWHAAWRRQDGKPRRGIFLTYLPDPAGDAVLGEKLRRTCRSLVSLRRPYLYGPLLKQARSSDIEHMATRLKELGVENIWPGEE